MAKSESILLLFIYPLESNLKENILFNGIIVFFGIVLFILVLKSVNINHTQVPGSAPTGCWTKIPFLKRANVAPICTLCQCVTC